MENICDPPFTIHHNFAVIVHSNWICPPKTRGWIWNPELMLQKPPIVWPCRMMTWHDLCATILASMRPQSYYDVKCNGREVFNIQITRMLRLQHRAPSPPRPQFPVNRLGSPDTFSERHAHTRNPSWSRKSSHDTMKRLERFSERNGKTSFRSLRG